jgi:glutaredoxin
MLKLKKLTVLLMLLFGTSCLLSIPDSYDRVPPEPDYVVMYSTSWCVYCKKAKTFLKENKIVYIEKNLEDPEDYAELVQIAKDLNYRGRLNAVPLFIIKRRIILGFSPTEILFLLNRGESSSKTFNRVKSELK